MNAAAMTAPETRSMPISAEVVAPRRIPPSATAVTAHSAAVRISVIATSTRASCRGGGTSASTSVSPVPAGTTAGLGGSATQDTGAHPRCGHEDQCAGEEDEQAQDGAGQVARAGQVRGAGGAWRHDAVGALAAAGPGLVEREPLVRAQCGQGVAAPGLRDRLRGSAAGGGAGAATGAAAAGRGRAAAAGTAAAVAALAPGGLLELGAPDHALAVGVLGAVRRELVERVAVLLLHVRLAQDLVVRAVAQ